MAQREFDVILYGASGFTGRQTVSYFVAHAPAALRWAVAGRDRARLESLQAGVPVLVVDAADASQTDKLAARTGVLLSTAGPYVLYGDRLVSSCVAALTHYVDITGEVAWVRSLIDRHHGKAADQGTRIVPFCGFDSVPADLGVRLLVEELGPELTEARGYFQAGGGGPNGGTIASARTTYSLGGAEQGRDPFLLCPGKQRALLPFEHDPTRACYDEEARCWVAPFPMSLIDTRVVRRSCSLIGIDVAYQEYFAPQGPLAPLVALAFASGTALFTWVMRSPRLRDKVAEWIPPGAGPSNEVMNKGWFRCVMRGKAADGRTAEVKIAGQGDAANRVTVMCVCESALAIACQPKKLPTRGGVLTPSTGIGEALIERLRFAGMTLAVSSPSEGPIGR